MWLDRIAVSTHQMGTNEQKETKYANLHQWHHLGYESRAPLKLPNVWVISLTNCGWSTACLSIASGIHSTNSLGKAYVYSMCIFSETQEMSLIYSGRRS